MKRKHDNKKNGQVKETRPFDGLIRQLNRETLVLVNLDKAKAFVRACFDRGIKVDVGDTYRNGVIIYKD